MLFQDICKILTDAESMGYMLQGFRNTLLLTFAAAAIGLVLGFTVAIVKISAQVNKYMKIPALLCNIYTTVFRGTPVALQLFIMVFAVFAIPGFKPYAAILTFGINSGAYVSENIRAGISSVDPGQMEAGRALGLSWRCTMLRVILPQAVKNIIPAIGNEMIALLKETAVAGYVAVQDLTRAGNLIRNNTYDAFNPLLLVAVVYLLLVIGMTQLLGLLERRLRRSDQH